MRFYLFPVLYFSLSYATSQSKLAMTYYVDRVVHYNKAPNYSADEVLSRRDDFIRFQLDQLIAGKNGIRGWIDLDAGWSLYNMELAYSRIVDGFNADVFFRRNTFYASDYENYPDDYEDQPVINQMGISLGYGQEKGILSYKIGPQFTLGQDSKKIIFNHTFYTETNYRRLDEEIFQIKNFRTIALEAQLEVNIIQKERWDFGLSYQFYLRRDFFDFANQSTGYEWTREEIIRQEIYSNAHKYNRIQNRLGLAFRIH